MSWFSAKVVESIGTVIKEGGKIINNLHTSDDEKLQARNALEELMNNYRLKIEELAGKFESEITKRHESDMNSDSWLSKNIRPLTLAVTASTVYLLIYLTVFSTLGKGQIQVLESWIPMLTGLLSTRVVFYFGSRGLEKVKALVQARLQARISELKETVRRLRLQLEASK